MIVKDLSKEFHPCPKPLQKTQQKSAEKPVEMKKKSKKLVKLENNRFSIITKDIKHCYICGAKKEDKHEIFGGRNRRTSMKYGLVIPVCRKCHDLIPKNKTLNEKLHKLGQKEFKKHYKTESFIKVFGKSYL